MTKTHDETPEYADPEWNGLPSIMWPIIIAPMAFIFLLCFVCYCCGITEWKKSYKVGYADGYQKRVYYEHGK
jgi:hypothetical protein